MVYSITVNMPGYLPSDEPEAYATAREAETAMREKSKWYRSEGFGISGDRYRFYATNHKTGEEYVIERHTFTEKEWVGMGNELP